MVFYLSGWLRTINIYFLEFCIKIALRFDLIIF